jgi:hypothetical protein
LDVDGRSLTFPFDSAQREFVQYHWGDMVAVRPQHNQQEDGLIIYKVSGVKKVTSYVAAFEATFGIFKDHYTPEVQEFIEDLRG